MWIMLTDSFLSIVQHPKRSRTMVVRARQAGDIEAVFPRARVYVTPTRDYGFRAFLPRKVVKRAIAAEVDRIDYGNFKDAVPEQKRHDAYLDVWVTMMNWGKGRVGTKRWAMPNPTGTDWQPTMAGTDMEVTKFEGDPREETL